MKYGRVNIHLSLSLSLCARARVCACARACMCVRARVCVRACVMGYIACDKLQWKLVLEGTDLLVWDRLICMC